MTGNHCLRVVTKTVTYCIYYIFVNGDVFLLKLTFVCLALGCCLIFNQVAFEYIHAAIGFGTKKYIVIIHGDSTIYLLGQFC